VRALYEFVHEESGIETVLTEVNQVWGDALETKGVLVRGRKEIGEWTRWLSLEAVPPEIDSTYSKRLVAKNSWLVIDKEEDRRTGFGRAYTLALEDRYREMGVQRVEVWATGEGVFAWARCGYRFHTNQGYPPDWQLHPISPLDEAACAANIWTCVMTQKILEGLLDEGRVTEAQLQRARSRFLDDEGIELAQRLAWTNPGDASARSRAAIDTCLRAQPISTPAEIACLGEEEAWEVDGQRMWLGKAVLTAPGWREHGWEGWKAL
jgi:hypothetical protein